MSSSNINAKNSKDFVPSPLRLPTKNTRTLFSTYAKLSEKLTVLTPVTDTYACVSGGKKC